SSDEKVGTFDTKGIFESTGLGDAIITATSDGGVSGTTDVLVVAVPILIEIEVTPSNATLFVGGTQTFTASGIDQYDESINTGNITWVSSNTDVGTINTNGVFKAVGLGDTTITATGDDSIVGTATVSVIEDPVLTTIVVTPENVTLYENEQQQFTATGYDQYGDPIDTGDLTWESDDSEVGTIDENGLFTAGESGETTISATGDGNVSGSATVVVEAEPTEPDEFKFTGYIRPNQELRHTLSVSKSAVMYVNLTWYGWGDLRLRVYDPDGKMVAESDSDNRRYQEEEITVNVTQGDWKIAVQSKARQWSISYFLKGTLTYVTTQ
ncbi:MAG: Ig-like domain-containing protein, partial [Sedimentisphaerales bacterium]|nr:Ig-like domain-containing protein [Sedimentisphaerales bacterium]